MKMLYEYCVSDITCISLTDRVPDSVENVHVAKARQGNEEKKREARKDHEAEAHESQLNKWTLNLGMFHRFGRVCIGRSLGIRSPR